MWSGEYRACVPRDLLRQLITLIPYFDGYGMRCMYLLALWRAVVTSTLLITGSMPTGQHDAQEFLRGFLDNLHEGLRVKHSLLQQQRPQSQLSDRGGASSAGPQASDADRDRWAGVRPRLPPGSIIADVFQGTLRYVTVRCYLGTARSGK